MIRVEYIENPAKQNEFIWSREIRDVSISKKDDTIFAVYTQADKPRQEHFVKLGTQTSFTGNVLCINLIIGDERYSMERIWRHFAEVKILLDQDRTERLLEEITDG